MHSKIENISRAALQAAQEGLSTLVGAEVVFSLQSASLMKKNEFMEHLHGVNSVTGLLLKGSYRGDGCLVFSRKSAIKLSGKMIMLPPAEMNMVLAESAFEEEMAAAFEEIPRMFITAFLEPFKSQELRISSILCRKSRIAIDRPGDAEFDYLIPEHTYYQVAAESTVDGLDAGVVRLLLPAFILVCSPLFATISQGSIEAAVADHSGAPSSEQLPSPPSSLSFAGAEEAAPRLGSQAIQRLVFLAQELTMLVGASVSVRAEQFLNVDGAEVYLTLENSPHVSGSFSLRGLHSPEVWVFAAPADALWLGALLSEGIHGAVLARLQAGSFNADRQDGFSEIAAVIINSFTAGFSVDVETDQDVVKKDLFDYQNGSSEPPDCSFRTDQRYQLCSLKIAAGALGNATLYLLFPESILDLPQPEAALADDTDQTMDSLMLTEAEHGDDAGSEAVQVENGHPWRGTVLVIDNKGLYGEAITKELNDGRILYDRVTALPEISKDKLESYNAIIMVIEELNEMALGLTIKINSLCSVPLIVAASQWRQSEVLKAVRYGVSDILMTPAQPGEVLEKLRVIERPGR